MYACMHYMYVCINPLELFQEYVCVLIYVRKYEQNSMC